jgi:hypothetical protein
VNEGQSTRICAIIASFVEFEPVPQVKVGKHGFDFDDGILNSEVQVTGPLLAFARKQAGEKPITNRRTKVRDHHWQ